MALWTPFGPRREKTCLPGFANNKSADQAAHPRQLISAFVICLLESIISKIATSEISIFYLVSVADKTSLNLTLSDASKTGFVAARPIYSAMKNFLADKTTINFTKMTSFASDKHFVMIGKKMEWLFCESEIIQMSLTYTA